MARSLSWDEPFVRIVSNTEEPKAREVKAWINGPASLTTLGNPVSLTPGFSQVNRADLKSENRLNGFPFS